MTIDIRHNHGQHRFETTIDDLLSVIDYRVDGTNLTLPHVGVAKELEGRGIAGELTRTALDWVREKNYRVIPVCPYVQAWIKRHPEYQDLL